MLFDKSLKEKLTLGKIPGTQYINNHHYIKIHNEQTTRTKNKRPHRQTHVCP